MTRHHIPFGTHWGMRIDVPYSSFIETEGYGWTCGQCPLDRHGHVLYPGDLIAQADRVADVIQDLHTDASDPGQTAIEKLVVYYQPEAPRSRLDMIRLYRRRFGDALKIVPVPLTHFYYDDMLIEVDGFTSKLGTMTIRHLAFAHDLAAGDLGAALSDWMEKSACGADRILSAHWFVPANQIDAVSDYLTQLNAAPDPGAIVGVSGNRVFGSLTQATGGPVGSRKENRDGVVLVANRAPGGWLWISGRCDTAAAEGLVAQTDAIMTRIDQIVDEEGTRFANAVKQTTHYVGSSRAEDLHDNMQIRNKYYADATIGPGSTGVPVDRLGHSSSATAIDILFNTDA